MFGSRLVSGLVSRLIGVLIGVLIGIRADWGAGHRASEAMLRQMAVAPRLRIPSLPLDALLTCLLYRSGLPLEYTLWLATSSVNRVIIAGSRTPSRSQMRWIVPSQSFEKSSRRVVSVHGLAVRWSGAGASAPSVVARQRKRASNGSASGSA